MQYIKLLFCFFVLSALIITGCSAGIKNEDKDPNNDVSGTEQLTDSDQQVENKS